MLEANGEWHTTDNKFHSDGWVPPKVATKVTGASPDSTTMRHSASATPQIKAEYPRDPSLSRRTSHSKTAEEIILDSDDDDDDDQVVGSTHNPSRRSTNDASDVIDLTLDDSDDEDPLPPPTTAASLGKRKERSPPGRMGSTMSDANKRSRSISRNGSWDRGGYYGGGSSNGRVDSYNNYGVRSSFSSPFNLPSLQLGSGLGGSSSAYVSPHAPPIPSPTLQSPLRSPPFHRDPPPPPVQLPPLMPPPHPSAQYLPPSSATMARMGLPPRPEWQPPSDRSYRQPYDDRRGW